MTHVYFSFADLDNEDGWVAAFQKDFRNKLGLHLGIKAECFGRDRFELQRLHFDTYPKLLVVILSPSYLNDQTCESELNHFLKTYGEGSNRILIIAKVPTCIEGAESSPSKPFEKLIAGFDLRAVRYFERDENTGKNLLWTVDDRKFKDQTALLAQFAKDALEKLEVKEPVLEVVNTVKSTIPKVFFGYETIDVAQYMERLKNDLRDKVTVVTADDISLDPKYFEQVRTLLQDCALSIHALGNVTPPKPGGNELSTLEIQLNLARERRRRDEMFTRIVWRPKHLPNEPASVKQGQLIGEVSMAKEYILGDYDALKEYVELTLKQLAPRPSVAVQGPRRSAYLMYETRDRDGVTDYASSLSQNYHILWPLFEGDSNIIWESHISALRMCDEVKVFWGESTQPWILVNLFDVRKSPGFGRRVPPIPTTVKIGPPITEQKRNFKKFGPDEFPDLGLNVE